MLGRWQRSVAGFLTGMFSVAALEGASWAQAVPPPRDPGYDPPQFAGYPPPPAGYWAPWRGGVLRLRSNEPNVTFYVKTGRSAPQFSFGNGPQLVTTHFFQPLCTAPCEVPMPPGVYVFGLTEGTSRILMSRPVSLNGNETLTGRWVSRETVRDVSFFAGVAAVAAGFLLLMREHVGVGLGVAGVGVGAVVVSRWQHDRAEIEVGP